MIFYDSSRRSKPAMIASFATTAPTQFLDIGGTRFAYRRFGNAILPSTNNALR